MKVIVPRDISYSTASLTRSSTGTYFDSLGNLQVANVDTLRYDWEPGTGQFRGVLVEPARTNVFLNSASSISPAITASLVTQTINLIRSTTYTMSYVGNAVISIQGLGLPGGDVIITGKENGSRQTYTFNTPSGVGFVSVTFTVNGNARFAQLEQGSFHTSWIPTTTTTNSRSEDVVTGIGLLSTDFIDSTQIWNSSTTYTAGAIVKFNNKIYEAQSSNTNVRPDTASITQWLFVRPDNIFAIFDRTHNAKSSTTLSEIKISAILPKPANSAACLASTNSSFHFSTSSTSKDKAVSFGDGKSVDGTNADFGGSAVVTDREEGDVVSFWLKSDTPGFNVGELVMGDLVYFGETQYGFQVQVIDYSKKEPDEFGNVTFVKGNFSKRASAKVFIKNSNYNKVIETAAALTGSPAIWIASEDPVFQNGAIVYGAYKDFTVEIPYPSTSLCSLEIEGLI